MSYQVRKCYRCGHTDSFQNPGPKRDILLLLCDGCDRETRHRPICDDWDGTWEMEANT